MENKLQRLIRAFIVGVLAIGNVLTLPAQDFSVFIDSFTIPSLNGVQAYAYGQYGGKWVIIGGRTDGLHRRQPPFTFLPTGNNTDVIVVDPVNKQFWTSSVLSLPNSIAEQMQSTNMEFIQNDSMLYIAGGYGYSATAQNHITFPNLTAVNVKGLINAVISGSGISSYFRQIADSNMAVTGGHLGVIDGYYYLVCGNKFTGRYNPMGMPTYTQQYTNQIRKFMINDDGVNLSISNYSAVTDNVNLHRRDYNMVNQVFPDGSLGFTIFSGVFQYAADLPYLNIVDINSNGHQVNNNFNQYLSQYHSANMPVYDSAVNNMYSVFFGGISQFYFDSTNTLVEDSSVPFVNTISMVTRSSSGAVSETKLAIQMPDLLGASSEFIINESVPRLSNQVINLSAVVGDTILAGYIFGGIRSSQPNIFFINNGTQSVAESKIYKVFIVLNPATSINEMLVKGDNNLGLLLYPNPANTHVFVKFYMPRAGSGKIYIQNMQGAVVKTVTTDNLPVGDAEISIDVKNIMSGSYTLTLSTGRYMQTIPMVIN